MLILLRLTHIVSGVFWVGTAIFTAFFLLPTIRALGPGGGAVMQHITQQRKLPAYFAGAGVLTGLSGIGLYSRASSGFNPAWIHSASGMTFTIGALAAITAMIIGIAVASPSAKQISELGKTIGSAGKPPSPDQQAEMGRLQARIGKASISATLFLIVATIAMAVARYMG
jgi:hypothetical protein